MKAINIFKTMTILIFTFLFTTAIFAQDKPKIKCKDDCKKECCATEANEVKHVCTDECKINGCTAVKAKDAKAMKHVCTDECKTNGCTAIKTAYECPMKCEPASNKPGECSKCGMKLKKKV